MMLKPSYTSEAPSGRSDFRTWCKRIGFIGFLFFLIKGLLWLFLPALLIYFGLN